MHATDPSALHLTEHVRDVHNRDRAVVDLVGPVREAHERDKRVLGRVSYVRWMHTVRWINHACDQLVRPAPPPGGPAGP